MPLRLEYTKPTLAVYVLTKNIKTGEQFFLDFNDADYYFQKQVSQMKDAMRSCKIVMENRTGGYLIKEMPLKLPSVIYELEKFNHTFGNAPTPKFR